MKYTYKTNGVCSRSIDIEIEDNIIKDVSFLGGCNGNLKGIAALTKGMKIDDVIEKLENVKCGFKNTSCPAQLAEALKGYKNGH
ncbi:MAG: TIGR03905 family TSCPD domain-containing protein [Clostridia bacterium]|nr:TIGR03905 family TSCPD domain-containing protein [Clostridia bacterium]